MIEKLIWMWMCVCVCLLNVCGVKVTIYAILSRIHMNDTMTTPSTMTMTMIAPKRKK